MFLLYIRIHVYSHTRNTHVSTIRFKNVFAVYSVIYLYGIFAVYSHTWNTLVSPWLYVAMPYIGHAIHLYPPDSIHDACWMPDCQISGHCFNSSFSINTKNLVLDRMLEHLMLRTRLCGTSFIAQPGWLFHFHPTKMVGQKCFVPVRYQLPKGKWAGLALRYLKWFVGLGGLCHGVITV